ncbi:sugar phosphate isomerase/epimerase family protein [Rhizobium grahamii]|uniref:Xylose isomerase n=2 Tax=Rhizobium grahamii TaxID=1120045 RepID=S3I5H0_9HYPH|nr:TIM barrel protein [Rhizobium grahamii]EPE94788.1 xylose isomerase [Rhizobium grahamii CCGE 502]RDJ05580.1 sugar phosphate isomerase [Rhizobium grahamii]
MTEGMLENGHFAVSTWSLHRLLGAVYPYGPDPDQSSDSKEPYGPGRSSLIEIPRQLASNRIGRLEICSFHLPSLDRGYLLELRAALQDADIVLQTLLVEDGDPSHRATAKRDIEWIAGWLEIAEALGARNMRVIAGKQAPVRENLERSAGHLGWLARQADNSGVRIVTENWFDLLPSPTETNWLLDTLEGKVGLNGDLGNWAAPDKYEGLCDIMRRAELCHAKANFSSSGLDGDDYRKALESCRTAGYDGPFTLIYDSTFYADEWDGIRREKAFIEEFQLDRQRAVG